MIKDVLISISGLHMDVNEQQEGSSEETIEIFNPGKYYYKNGKHYVFFEEMEEGFHEITKTQIRWQGSEFLEVSKKGLSNMHMILEKNTKNRCYYNTPFGQLNLGMYMTEMQVDEKEDDIDIRARYLLDVNFQPTSECNIHINIKPRDSKDFSITKEMNI